MVFYIGANHIYRFPDDADGNSICNNKNLSWRKLQAYQIFVYLFTKTIVDFFKGVLCVLIGRLLDHR